MIGVTIWIGVAIWALLVELEKRFSSHQYIQLSFGTITVSKRF